MPVSAMILGFGLVAAVIIYGHYRARPIRDGRWQEYDGFRMVTTIDGKRILALRILRRYDPDAGWQYREMTESEMDDRLSREVW